jgi:DNA-binding IclR family transcriptional regulator
MVASAVPLTDSHGRFVAALAVHGPIQRLSVDQAIANKEILLAAAKRMQLAIIS